MGRPTAHHPVFARIYPALNRGMERAGLTEYRRRLLAGASGRVVELGPGDGATFQHYPATVTGVLAVEPEPHLRRLAEEAGEAATVPVDVVEGSAERIPARDESCDAVVVSLVLCSVPHQEAALREVRRVLRPGGQLRLLEHVRADRPGAARLQRVLDATVWPWFGGGCHTARDTPAVVRESGFDLDDVASFRLGELVTPAHPMVLAIATRR